MDNSFRLSQYGGMQDALPPDAGVSSYFAGRRPFTPINPSQTAMAPPPSQMQPPPSQGEPMEPDPLMNQLQQDTSGRALSQQMLAGGIGSILARLIGGSSAAGEAAQGSLSNMTDMYKQKIQQMQGMQAGDRERKFRLGEEKIQGAHKMMEQLHGVDMAGMPDHVRQEMGRITEMYNQKMINGLTDKEATEVLAMGARMQQLMQEAGASEGTIRERGRLGGLGKFEEARGQFGGEFPQGATPGTTPSQFSMEERARTAAKARTDAANIAASAAQARLGRQLEVAEIRAGNAAVQAAVAQNNMLGETMLDQDTLNEIFLNGVARAKQSMGGTQDTVTPPPRKGFNAPDTNPR